MYSSIWFCLFLMVTAISTDNTELHIGGTTANGWEFVRDLFKQNFEQERDLGGSVAIYHQGKLVVDLWGGWFDESRTKLYDNDTLQLVFSSSKGLVAVAVALCVQRGLLDYSALVIKYWPEYGQNGKENTTVADILSHRAGLPFDDADQFEDYLNWTGMINKLEQFEPVWPPGTTHGYHTLTYGWLAGELVRRVDPKKRTLGQFIRDEIAVPIEIEFYIGLPASQEYRVSPLNAKDDDLSDNEFNKNRTHQAEIPAANGITNGRSLARLYAALIGDVEDNKYKRILTEDILKRATKSNTPDNEIDFVTQARSQFGMGFMLWDQVFPLLGPGVFGHSGIGGSIGLAIPTKKFSFAYVMNRMNTEVSADNDPRYKSILAEVATMINRITSTTTTSTTSPTTTSTTTTLLGKQIDKWECDSINKIQQTAGEARKLVAQYAGEHINKIEMKLTKLTEQLKETRQENDINEIHLNQLKETLTKLEEALTNSSNFTIQEDSSSFISKISVVISSSKYIHHI